MSDQRTPKTIVENWFHKQGFTRVHFSAPTERISTFSVAHMLVYKLRERP